MTQSLATARTTQWIIDAAPGVLVNNAGSGLVGAVEESSERHDCALFELDVFGLVTLPRAAWPVLRAHGSERIDLSSVAGQAPQPDGTSTRRASTHGGVAAPRAGGRGPPPAHGELSPDETEPDPSAGWRDDMTNAQHGERIRDAARALGVDGLGGSGAEELLRLASATTGAAEAMAMVAASALPAGSPDPMGTVDDIAFRAAGMRGPDPQLTKILWLIWGIRRARAGLTELMIGNAESGDLVAAAELIDSVHAILSALAYPPGDADRDACRDLSRDAIERASALLARRPTA